MDLKKSFRHVNVNKYEDNIGVENCVQTSTYIHVQTSKGKNKNIKTSIECAIIEQKKHVIVKTRPEIRAQFRL